MKKIRKPQSMLGIDSRFNKKTHFYLYGMGLLISDYEGKVTYSHTGGIGGFLSSTLFIPEEKLGIVVLTNTDKNDFYIELNNQIRDAFLGIPFKNYSEKSLKKFTKRKNKEIEKINSIREIISKEHTPSLALKAYTGKYTNDVYGEIELKLENEKIKYSLL